MTLKALLTRTFSLGEAVFTQGKMVLPRTNEIPTHQTLTWMLSLANRNPNKTIELPWFDPKSQINYTLDVSCAMKERQDAQAFVIRWHLNQHSDTTNITLWSHVTSDVILIMKFVWLELQTAVVPAPTAFVRSNDQPEEEKVNSGSSFDLPSSLQVVSNLNDAVTFAGCVSEVEISSILQSISILKFTGRLDFVEDLQQNLVYFEEGNPIHASLETTLLNEHSLPISGEAVIMDLLLWRKGNFKFNLGIRTSERTIKRRLESLLLESACLRDYDKSLEDSDFTGDSVVCRLVLPSSEDEFRRIVSIGAPIAVHSQQQFFDLINSSRTVKEIGAALGWHRVNYLPVLWNLYKTGLVGIKDVKAIGAQSANRLSAILMEDSVFVRHASGY